MSIGICTRYSHHEAAFAGIRLANALKPYGVGMMTMTEQPVALDIEWDDKVCRNVLFTDWIEDYDWIIWTTVPHDLQIDWVNKHGKNSAILVRWHELTYGTKNALVNAHVLMTPSAAAYNTLYDAGLKNTFWVPWDTGHPFTKKSPNHKPTPRLLLPIWDGNARRTNATTIEVVARVLFKCPKAELTIAYTTSTLSPVARKLLKKLAKSFPGRVDLVTAKEDIDRALLFQTHDLTLWPTCAENLCTIGLMSLSQGTPFISFCFSPVDEVASCEGAIVVPCHSEWVDATGLGAVLAEPDYIILESVLVQLLSDPDSLQQRQQSICIKELQKRRRYFNKQLSTLINNGVEDE